MLHEEVEIQNKNYNIKASLKIPDEKTSTIGIIMAHGSIINRQSLLRNNYSLGEYLCKELGTYVIAPDFQGETLHKGKLKFSNYSEILNLTADYIKEKYNLDTLMGFGHSMGCIIMAQALQDNPSLESIVNYGSPFNEFISRRQSNFIDYLINYITKYEYNINIKNLFKYIFDEATYNYFENVMCKEDDYCSSTYEYVFESNTIREIIEASKDYTNNIKIWGKPALLLYGSEDNLTKRVKKRAKSFDENILTEHILGASHVTPCMDSRSQLLKLKPAVTFYRKTCNIERVSENVEPQLNKLTTII